jgi:hypothetical protein
LSTSAGKIKLAQSVTRFCNAEEGGLRQRGLSGGRGCGGDQGVTAPVDERSITIEDILLETAAMFRFTVEAILGPTRWRDLSGHATSRCTSVETERI